VPLETDGADETARFSYKIILAYTECFLKNLVAHMVKKIVTFWISIPLLRLGNWLRSSLPWKGGEMLNEPDPTEKATVQQ
jgi:hypothetical protein